MNMIDSHTEDAFYSFVSCVSILSILAIWEWIWKPYAANQLKTSAKKAGREISSELSSTPHLGSANLEKILDIIRSLSTQDEPVCYAAWHLSMRKMHRSSFAYSSETYAQVEFFRNACAKLDELLHSYYKKVSILFWIQAKLLPATEKVLFLFSREFRLSVAGYFIPDIRRMQEASVQMIEGKVKIEVANAERILAEAAKLHAELEKSLEESKALEQDPSDSLRARVEAYERVIQAMSAIQQAGGQISFDREELERIASGGKPANIEDGKVGPDS